MTIPRALQPTPLRHLARLVFFAFLLTFIASRVLVILIMTRRIPDLFLHTGQTHVHHLNYGIFLLSTIGAILLFADLSDRAKGWMALAYGTGMALTFDEFGMWLHLGGGYWQRASFDAVVVILSLLGLLAFMPQWKRLNKRHYTAAAISTVALIIFCWLSLASVNIVEKHMGARWQEMEEKGPQ